MLERMEQGNRDRRRSQACDCACVSGFPQARTVERARQEPQTKGCYEGERGPYEVQVPPLAVDVRIERDHGGGRQNEASNQHQAEPSLGVAERLLARHRSGRDNAYGAYGP